MQKIGEQMSVYSDSLTEHSIKIMQAKKQAAELIVEKATTEIEQIGSVVDRELKILDMQRTDLDPTKINLVNMDLFTNPLDFLPSMRLSEVEKTRNETNAILTEEQERQKRINEIKEASLQVIYDKAKEKREQDISDTTEDLKEASKKVEIAAKNKSDTISKYAKESLQNALEEFDDWLTRKDFTMVINTTIAEVETGDPTLQAAKNRGFKKVDAQGNVTEEWDEENYNKFVQSIGEKRGYTDAWHLSQIDSQLREQLELEGKTYGGNSNWDRKSKTEREDVIDALFKNKDTSNDKNSVIEVGDRNPYVNLKASEDGKTKAATIYEKDGSYWEVISIEQDGVRLRGANGKEYKYQYDTLKDGTWYRPNAYATPDTLISSGPITVGEKAPEFVMFKDGTGAIFDKTTILNGSEVDFVSDASYATGGKSNGTFVEGSYANGGNLSGAKETATEIQQEVSENNKTMLLTTIKKFLRILKLLHKTMKKLLKIA